MKNRTWSPFITSSRWWSFMLNHTTNLSKQITTQLLLLISTQITLATVLWYSISNNSFKFVEKRSALTDNKTYHGKLKDILKELEKERRKQENEPNSLVTKWIFFKYSTKMVFGFAGRSISVYVDSNFPILLHHPLLWNKRHFRY